MKFRLIYSSTATPQMSESDLRMIAMLAALKNEELKVTGLLVTHNDHIMQVLEGEETAVRSLYSRIEKDTRHFDVKILSEGHCEKSDFSSWSMGYRPVETLSEMEIFFALSKSALEDFMSEEASPEIKEHVRNFVKKSELS